MEQKTIMILGAGEAQIPVIRESKRLNIKTIVVDYDTNAPGFQFADVSLFISTIDETEVLSAAKKFCIDGILTTSDYPVRVVAYVCERLGLKGLSINSAITCTNKFLLRECFKSNAIQTPKYFKFSSLSEADHYKLNFEFPLIIKPVDSSASRGVKKVNNFDELQQAFEDAKLYSKCGDVIVEEFLEGPEYSIETLCFDGVCHIIAFTEKTTKGAEGMYFVEDKHVIPSNISLENQLIIKNIVLKAVKAVGINNSASHIELKLTKQGPIIIEIGARLGGDFITSDLVPLATGINMLENIIFMAIGQKINVNSTRSLYSGIQFINSKNYSLIEQHIKKIKNKKELIKFEIKEFKNVDLKSSLDRLGYYICIGESRSELEKLLNYN